MENDPAQNRYFASIDLEIGTFRTSFQSLRSNIPAINGIFSNQTALKMGKDQPSRRYPLEITSMNESTELGKFIVPAKNYFL